MRYAENTIVTPERSLSAIQKELKRYGANKFAFVDEGSIIGIAFEYNNRRVRFVIRIPLAQAFSKSEQNRKRTPERATVAHEKAIRQQWRALHLVIKAKLEAVESGIETFDEAFMAHLLLPNGGTVADYLTPQLDTIYRDGKMPPLLGDGK